jgi:hypothetical protein
MRSIKQWAGITLAVLLSACGGGGGGGGGGDSTPGTPSPPVATTTVTGNIAPGPVNGAAVQLLSVDSQGRTTLLQEVRSGTDGGYAFTASITAETVVMVSATGGTWTDPISKAGAALDTKLRAVEVWTGPLRRINATPYTEINVRSLEKATTPDWSPAKVRAVGLTLAGELGVASLTDFLRIDLTQPPGATAPKADDVAHALVNGAFIGFWRRLQAASATTDLSAALDGLHRLTFVDTEDDRLGPAMAGGTVDYVDVTSLTADDKLRIKGLILYGKDILPTAATVAEAMPKGVSSGAGLAPMPDDQFRLIGQRQGRTHFNQRGALVSYGEGDAKTSRNELYTASVAEVFADGDIGIGRWNGGVEIVTLPSGGGLFVQNPSILSTSGRMYAAAKPVSQIPACGSRRLSLAGSTKLTFTPLNWNDVGPDLTLTADTALSALYLGNVQIGADVGIRTSGGEVVRLRSQGALEHPELAGLQLDAENEIYLNVPVSALFPAGTTAKLTVRPAGAGARKAVAHLSIGLPTGGLYAALAFTAPDAAPDALGCATTGAPGAGIDPKPAAGNHFVFLSHNNESLFMGVPRDEVSFGASGELTSVLSAVRFSGPAFDLAGNEHASIGRVTVSSGNTVDGNLVQRSQPYAVVRPATIAPRVGTAQYQLVAATAVTAERGSGTAQLPPGVIDSASVTVYFDQYPIGSPNVGSATARVQVAGRFSGISFGTDVSAAQGFGPLDVRSGGQTLVDMNRVMGAFTGPDGEYLALVYMDGVNGIPVKAALLFRRQGS